ncbi:hypothetical protein [Stieleria mannarensis]|uniref:hypothetical protein n=1 Tax=Stieleria mannarensis TaxID=2755585 RepID=UPI001600B3B8|nr:hypothetical protein [Rhodopirellula sp. JC639]
MRLPVILVQNPPASAASLAESLVGNLIGRAGLDLTLVDRFDSLAVDSTDRMTLDGITVPSAVLDWRSEEEIVAALAAIDFHGTRCPHQLDPDGQATPGTSPRRLFLFNLTKHKDVEAIIAELDRLRASLSVRTVSLASPGGGNPITTKQNTADRPDQAAAAKPSPPATPPPQPAKPASTAAPRSDQHLDNLIDQLDQLDV